MAVSTAWPALVNTENVLSPSPRHLTRTPPPSPTMRRAIASWVRRATAMVSESSSQRLVDPSMSVIRNVTIPVGSGVDSSTPCRVSAAWAARSVRSRRSSAGRSSPGPVTMVIAPEKTLLVGEGESLAQISRGRESTVFEHNRFGWRAVLGEDGGRLQLRAV